MRSCGAQNASGQPCRAHIIPGSQPPRCVAHADGRGSQRMSEIGRLGGLQRQRQLDRPATAAVEPTEGPALETKGDVANEIRRVYSKLVSCAMDARTGFAALQALQVLMATNTLAEGQPPEARFFAQFDHIEATADGEGITYGVTADGVRVPLSDHQVSAWNRLLRSQLSGSSEEVTLTIKRRRYDKTQYEVRQAEPDGVDVVCEFDPPAEQAR